jgi:glyoxylase-like metal-dependent hydrolase (beta-lactamase superfamily II)
MWTVGRSRYTVPAVERLHFFASFEGVSRTRRIWTLVACRQLRWCATLLLLFLAISTAADDIFQTVKVADGIYAEIARPTFRLNCNAAIILQDDGVVVVDTESIPSAAREVIKAIKRITDKPVRYVVITHFHGDHFQGAQAYLNEWPGVQFISSDATREAIAKRGIPRMRRETLELPARIEGLRKSLNQATDEKQKEQIQTSLEQAEAYFAELKEVSGVLPSLTVDRSLTLHSKAHAVQIMWLGMAHTDGDLFVYIPDARVIATGDALHNGTPTMTDASPYEWIRTLDAAEKLDFDWVIGGHGDVMHGKAMFGIWKQYLTDLMAGVAKVSASGGTLAEARQTLAPVLIAQYGKKFESIPGPFSQTVYANIDIAFRIVCGRLLQ